ncbi:hypothetical protein KAS79_02725 [Candidatus Parcubacteria bacterium]|nr:hypothetical protein [Candidatus Parcubacteria bacterium]
MIKEKLIAHPWRVFFWEAVLFSLCLGLGIITALKLNRLLEVQKIFLSQISFSQFLFYFLFGTFFILAICFFAKFRKRKGAIFKLIFVLAVFGGGFISLSLLMPNIFALILIWILIFTWLKKPSVLSHNFIVILGLAGAGANLGLRMSPWLVVSLLIILSVYDFIAVYKTKHMVKMAKEMLAHQAILGFVVPQEISGFKESLKEIKTGGRFLILGGGDVVFPLLLAVSLLSQGILNSLIVAVFALIGLFASFYFFINQKIRKPIPALPPIALFSIIGFLITLLF